MLTIPNRGICYLDSLEMTCMNGKLLEKETHDF